MARILLVEDEPAIRRVLVDYLGRLGHEVVETASARDARLEILAPDADFALALVDWSLPDLSGRELVLLLGQTLPGCAVVVATGLGAAAVGDTLRGVRTVLRKPFSLRAVGRVVDQILAPPDAPPPDDPTVS